MAHKIPKRYQGQDVSYCAKCKKWKPKQDFHKDSTRISGVHPHCKVCKKEWRSQNSAHLIQKAKEWNRANRERYVENVRGNERKNPEKTAQTKHLWYKRNIDKSRVKSARRHALKLGAEGTHTAADIQRQYEVQNGLCYWCGVSVGKTYHCDHAIPLSRGGANGPKNIVITCPSCNRSKGDKLPHEWKGNKRNI